MKTTKSVSPKVTSRIKQGLNQNGDVVDLPLFLNIKLERRDGAVQLEEFARNHADYAELEGGVLHLRTEDMTITIRHDLDEKLELVFIGTITTYCPQRVLFDTGCRPSIDNVLSHLKAGIQNHDLR
jgi:hypothetical protein